MTNQQGAPEALYASAMEFAAEKASISYVQRKCRCSWNDAEQMLERMVREGIIATYNGRKSAALVEAQQPAAHVQNPAEIEHVAGDVSKNGPELNMAQQPAPSAACPVDNNNFDHQTAADVLNGKTVSDEAMRKFVAVARWAHDDRVGLRATLLSVRGELASREAEIALLKKALMDAEAPQPSPTPQADSQPAPDAWLVTGIYTKQAFPMHCSAMAFLNGLLSSDPDGGYKIVPLFIHQQTTAGACGCEEPPTNPGDTESGPEGEWYCETHPGQLMGHAGCGGAGIPACGRIPCLMNQLRLTKQQVRETGRMRDEMAAMAHRAARAPAGSVTAPAGEATGKNLLQVQAWVIPDGNGGGQFSWQKQDERFWIRLTPPAQAADSVLEDAARYEYLRDCTMGERNRLEHYSGPALDVVIDAARKQGGV